jgi:ATP-binding cassette subfamily F protein uup
MTYLSVENLTKSYGVETLFSNLTFGIKKGDKTALVAENGTGKSTLLKIIAGKETPDSGEVMSQNNIKIGFLEQEPALDESKSIREYISTGNSEIVTIVQEYEKAVQAQAENYNEQTQQQFEKASEAMEAANAWDFEQRMETILGILQIHDLEQPISTLSGGERKRVALAFVLLDEPDFLILDEPTNHLDVEMIEWLENYLIQSSITLFMVTHDRYFLDRVCNHIIEMENIKLYHHKGNYQYFLQKRAEREEIEQTQLNKAKQLYKKELEWMRRGPKARTSKSKSRIDDFYETKEKAHSQKESSELQLETSMARMGKKIVELRNVTKSFDDLVILDSFSYSFTRGERIGIIGKNGAGKSTFLNVLTGIEPVDSGEIVTGETIVFGHYKQKGIDIDENERVIDVMKNIARVVKLADGSEVSASQFLEHFMFTSDMQYTPVHKLSGGEKRRLGLMMTLIKNPNFLILDEPTNDLDLTTLQKLEEFLGSFGGCLILVSHDRFFMDKLVDHYFAFEGDGEIRDFHGTYEEYRALKAEETARAKRESSAIKEKPTAKKEEVKPKKGNSLSYGERKEFKKLEKQIAALEEEKESVASELNSTGLDYELLTEKTARFEEIESEIDEKTMRWLELAERDEGA